MARRKYQTATTGDPWLDLWAAVCRLAILDAQRGNRQAAKWLWQHEPDVAEIAAGKFKKSPLSSVQVGVHDL